MEGLTKYIKYGDSLDGVILPSHEHANAFTSHIDKCCDATVTNAYYHDQYMESIPKALKNSNATALYFIRELGKNWEEEMNSYFGNAEWLDG